MKLETTALLTVAAFLAFSRLASGAETFVACPVQQLEAGVTTKLPGGWWATPQQGGLINTEVMTIAGKQRLVCNYRMFDASVPIMSEMPKSFSVCKAAQGGFRCMSTGAVQGDGSVRNPNQKGPKSALQPATQASASVPVVNSNEGAYVDDVPTGADAGYDAGSEYEAGSEYDAATQSSAAPEAAAAGTLGGIVDEEAARQQVEKFIKKKLSGDKTASARICGDPAAMGLGVKQGSVSSTPTKDPNRNLYAFRIEGEVRNVAETAFSSSGGLQSVELYELRSKGTPRLVTSLPFESLAAGESLVIGTDIPKWRTQEKSPDYQLRVTFAPEIYQDGDPANDECNGKNNIITLRGSDIDNALLSAN